MDFGFGRGRNVIAEENVKRRKVVKSRGRVRLFSAANRRRHSGTFALLSSALLLLVLAPFGFWGVASASPDIVAGDYVSFGCAHGAIYLGSTEVCHDGSANVDVCSGTCTGTIKAVMDTGYAFTAFSSASDFCYGIQANGCGSYTTSNPSSWWATCSGQCTGSATLNPGCTFPGISNVKSPVQSGYRQAWVNWSYSGTPTPSPSFQWQTAGGVSQPDPSSINQGSINLNALSAGTTYDYTIDESNACGLATSSGSFTTASSMLTIDGSNVTYSTTGVASLSTTLTTSLTHDLIIAQVASSAGTGDVSSCSDSPAKLTWTQRAAYQPASGSPWVFEWYAQASGSLSKDTITCSYSAANGLGGLVVFGVANAYMASPYDPGSGNPCKAYGTTTVSCSVTTTSPDDMLLGLVASYHANGAPLSPGGGFTQIQQEDAGPYVLAEFEGTGASTGSYTISASKSDGVGMALIGDAVEVAPFIGWVSQLVTNPSELDQVGPAIPGASVWPVAHCGVGYTSGSGDNQGISFNNEAFGLPATSVSSSGYFQLGLPDTYTTTLSYWTGGTKGYEVTDTETITLSSGGSCVSALDGTTSYTVSNPEIFLFADNFGYWNATVWVSSTVSASNDFQQFGLLPTGYGVFPEGVAYVHRASFPSDASVSCSITEVNGESQTVDSSSNIFGYQFGSTASGSVASGTTASDTTLVYPNIAMDFHTTGVVNESQGTFQYQAVLPYGPGYDLSTDTASFSDWQTSIPSVGNTSNTTTFERTVGPLSNQTVWAENGGSYTYSSGFNLQFGGSISPTGWDGLGLSTPGIGLEAVTSSGSSSSHAVQCILSDSSSTYALQFMVTLDGTQVTASPPQAINMHVWFLDQCVPNSQGCP
jgi:hypothetical protein